MRAAHTWRSVWVLAAALASASDARADLTPAAQAPAVQARARILDLPFLPQSEALCGGAAAAMVFRYWGASSVYAEDFAPLVDRRAGGISLAALTSAVQERGWSALAFAATAHDVQNHLDRARPVIALIDVGAGRLHYVVIVAWARDRVVYHDPAANPYRVASTDRFMEAWRATQFAALLILPRTPRADATEHVEAVAPGGSAREHAGSLFMRKQWRDAASLAAMAVEEDPADAAAWQLLAASRFLQGDAAGALDAWNRRGEPRVDVVQIDGLTRTRYAVAANLLGLPPQTTLTRDGVARAARRLSALPSAQLTRVSYAPRENGTATVHAAIVERPLMPHSLLEITAAAVYAATSRDARVAIASPTGNGELWNVSGRWWSNRPRVALALDVPQVGVWPGRTRIEGSWDRQAVLFESETLRASAANRVGGERRRAFIAVSDWSSSNLQWQVSAALDRWATRGHHGSLGVALDHRLLEDRIAVRGDMTFSAPLGGEQPYAVSSLVARWRSSADAFASWTAEAGVHGVTAATPLELWSAADTGIARSTLLRAHPLLAGGAIKASRLGRTLLNGTLEFQRPFIVRTMAQIHWAAFVDAASLRLPLSDEGAGAHVDAGVGVRIKLPAAPGTLRLDVARGVRDRAAALSVAWQQGWPGW